MAPLPRRDEPQTYILLTLKELSYLDACIYVADGDGEHERNFGVDGTALRKKITKRIEELS